MVSRNTRSIEREGVRLAMDYLRGDGCSPEDVSSTRPGYDVRVGTRRIEVKASAKKNRAWDYVDVRKGCGGSPRIERRGGKTRLVWTFRELPFDEMIEVTGVGSKDVALYHYPKRDITKYMELRSRIFARVTIPESVRRQGKRSLPRGSE